MISYVLVDSDPSGIAHLRELIDHYCPGLQRLGEAGSPADAVNLITAKHPELVFISAEIPQTDTFELLSRFAPLPFEYILVSAHEHLAAKAFAHNALHYLIKPVHPDSLQLAVHKATTLITQKRILHHFGNMGQMAPPTRPIKIALPTHNGLTFYPIDDIVCCTARNTYTNFDFVGGNSFLASGTLKAFEDKLPSGIFCRVHHSHLINMNHVLEYTKGKGGQVKMVTGKIIEVSLRKRDEFLNRLR